MISLKIKHITLSATMENGQLFQIEGHNISLQCEPRDLPIALMEALEFTDVDPELEIQSESNTPSQEAALEQVGLAVDRFVAGIEDDPDEGCCDTPVGHLATVVHGQAK